MFRIAEDPSSGTLVQCLAKNYSNDSIVSVDMDMVVLWQHIVTVVRVCSSLYRKTFICSEQSTFSIIYLSN
jgi:hypothetical protein